MRSSVVSIFFVLCLFCAAVNGNRYGKFGYEDIRRATLESSLEQQGRVSLSDFFVPFKMFGD